jgi:hypothetical protein
MNPMNATKTMTAIAAIAYLLTATSAQAWVRQNLRDQPGFSNHNLVLPSGRLEISVERDGSATAGNDAGMEAIRAAVRTFNDVPGSSARVELGEPFDFPSNVDSRDGFEMDGVNRLYFFQEDDPAFRAVALTAVFYDVNTGRILESDTAMNEADFTFSTATPPDPNAQLGTAVLDLQEVLTHEFFHAFGFDHAPMSGRFDPTTGLQVGGWYTGDWSEHATSFPIATGTISGRTLQPDDAGAQGRARRRGERGGAGDAGRGHDQRHWRGVRPRRLHDLGPPAGLVLRADRAARRHVESLHGAVDAVQGIRHGLRS